MIFQTLSVQRNGAAANSRPRIQLVGDWLGEMGFANGALVQSLPETGGFAFILCNENINYAGLFHSTKEKGGTLIRAYVSNGRTQAGTALVTTGKHILKGGLNFGDRLLAKCEYGRIRMRKVAGGVRLVHAAKAVNARTGVVTPKVSLLGGWLGDIGFTPDTLVTVADAPGCITFTAHGEAVIYADVVKHARQNRMRLVQVSAKGGVPLLNVSGPFVEKSGFSLGDIFCAEYGHGVIRLRELDPQRFGF